MPMLLNTGKQRLKPLQRYYKIAEDIFWKVREEHAVGRNPSLDAFLHSIKHMLEYIADWHKGLEDEERKWAEDEKRTEDEKTSKAQKERKKNLRSSLHEPLQLLEVEEGDAWERQHI
jgi:hypothetical protein